MDLQEIGLPVGHRAVLNRFVEACRADKRVVAAFLGGSYARGTADAYSDLDIYLITTDESYEDFYAGRGAFVRLLGEAVFLENFGLPNIVFYIFSDGTEGELGLGRESQFKQFHGGPYRVLLDKKRILEGAVFPEHERSHVEQVETLRSQVYGFWHDLSHFITAMGRGNLWWASGQIEALRACCVNLARLRQNFSHADVGDEAYFKVEQALPAEQLSALQETFGPMEQGAMLRAARVILGFYQELAPQLAQTYGINYPADLERVMVDRLEKVCAARLI